MSLVSSDPWACLPLTLGIYPTQDGSVRIFVLALCPTAPIGRGLTFGFLIIRSVHSLELRDRAPESVRKLKIYRFISHSIMTRVTSSSMLMATEVFEKRPSLYDSGWSCSNNVLFVFWRWCIIYILGQCLSVYKMDATLPASVIKFKWNFIYKISVYFLAHSRLEFSFYSVIINCIISRKLFLFSVFFLSGIASLVKSSSR